MLRAYQKFCNCTEARQIELAFKRIKSVLGLGRLLIQDPECCHAGLHGKQFTSLLVARMIGAARKLPPGGNELDAPPEQVAGNRHFANRAMALDLLEATEIGREPICGASDGRWTIEDRAVCRCFCVAVVWRADAVPVDEAGFDPFLPVFRVRLRGQEVRLRAYEKKRIALEHHLQRQLPVAAIAGGASDAAEGGVGGGGVWGVEVGVVPGVVGIGPELGFQ